MGKIHAIGKVHIKNIKALREWYAAGEFKKLDKGNWSPHINGSEGEETGVVGKKIVGKKRAEVSQWRE